MELKREEILQVISLYSLDTMDLCLKFKGNPMVVEMFQSGPRWWTYRLPNRPTSPSLDTCMAKYLKGLLTVSI